MREVKEINIRIGQQIKAARETAGYTQEYFSELLEITPNHLSAIERGVSGASLETVEKICTQLGVSADVLFFGTEELDDSTMRLARQLNRVPSKYRPQVQKVLSSLLEVLAIKGK